MGSGTIAAASPKRSQSRPREQSTNRASEDMQGRASGANIALAVATELRHLDQRRAAVLESLCEAIVPGSGRVGPVVYIDALMSEMAEPERAAAL